jgi:inosine-uridine nucleoside N-ribohydrolase
MMKVLLDTDIGSDIDDAVCLAYLLGQSRCKLMGITTVTGEAVKRAQMAASLCSIACREVPIYPGVEEPLVVDQKQPRAPQAVVLTEQERSRRFPTGEAVDFLRRTIRKYPREIHLLTIGPLTNVGLLFGLDPEIPSLLSSLTAMAGVYLKETRGAHPTEWNIACDPHAAAVVLGKAPKNTRLIGLDVTLQLTMAAQELKSRFSSPLLNRVAEFAEIWFEKAEKITFHDPLAAVVLFNEAVCGYQSGVVGVHLGEESESGKESILGSTLFEVPGGRGKAASGREILLPELPPGKAAVSRVPLQVATTVNPNAFFQEYFSVFSRSFA